MFFNLLIPVAILMVVAVAIKYQSQINAFLASPLDWGNTMTGWRAVAVFILIILPVSGATYGLATYTLGEALTPRRDDRDIIGGMAGLLTAAFAAYLFFFSRAAEASGSRLSSILIVCGAACILGALALQFYLVHIASDNARRSAEPIAQNPALMSGNVTVRTEIPNTVKPMGYFVFLAGAWLAVAGIHVGMGRMQPEPIREPLVQPGIPIGVPRQPEAARETAVQPSPDPSSPG